MGSISNNNWYNLNSTRKYPLDDGCTGITDDGQVLPATIITDLSLTLPRSLGIGGMVSSLKVSDTMVSVTFLALDHPIRNSFYDPASSLSAEYFKPLCAVTLAKPVETGVPYPLTPFSDGVVGWIVFGEGIKKKFDGKFSNPVQSALNPKNCRYYRDFPVTSIGKVGASTKLQGMVKLIAGNDIDITAETQLINGEEKQVISFALKEKNGVNVLDVYRGPCSGRPESKTCAQESIEFINTVQPDCNGNIDIIFESPFRTARYPDNVGGISVDYPVGLIDACTAKDNLPDSKGVLPAEYQNDDQCNPSSFPDPDGNAGGNNPPQFPPAESISSSTLDMLTLPACMNFDLSNSGYWQVMRGSFYYVTADSPMETCGTYAYTSSDGFIYSSVSGAGAVSVENSYSATNLASSNVSIWYNGDYSSTVGVRILTDLKVVGAGSSANGGVVLNYRPNNYHTADEYFVAEINTQQSALNIKRFNGATLITLASVVGLGIESDTWYRLEVITAPGSTSEKVDITANLYSIPSLALVSTVNVESNAYLPDNGKVGVCSNRANAIFSYFYMENV